MPTFSENRDVHYATSRTSATACNLRTAPRLTNNWNSVTCAQCLATRAAAEDAP